MKLWLRGQVDTEALFVRSLTKDTWFSVWNLQVKVWSVSTLEEVSKFGLQLKEDESLWLARDQCKGELTLWAWLDGTAELPLVCVKLMLGRAWEVSSSYTARREMLGVGGESSSCSARLGLRGTALARLGLPEGAPLLLSLGKNVRALYFCNAVLLVGLWIFGPESAGILLTK